MAEEKKPSQIQVLMYQHGEKIGVGVVALLVFVVFALMLMPGESEKVAKQVQSASTSIENASREKHADRQAPEFAVTSELHDNEILKPWRESIPGADKLVQPTAGNWVTTYPTSLKLDPQERVITDKTVYLIGTVTLQKVEAGLQGIKLNWSVTDAKAVEKNEKVATIDEIVIERTSKGKKEKIATVSAKETEYVDAKVEKRGTYEYQLTPVTKDSQYRLDKGTNQGPRSSTMSTTMLDEWNLTFTNAQPGTKSVYIKIEKYDKAAGGNVSVNKIHKEGDEIGKWEDDVEYEEPDGIGGVKKVVKREVTFKHKVNVSGRSYTVEFNTGAKLQAVRDCKVTVTYDKCKVIRDGGTFLRCDRAPQTDEVKGVVEIQYTDADSKVVSIKMKGGKQVTMKSETELDPSEGPDGTDPLCKEHGKKVEEDPEKEKKEKHEREASTLLAEADQFRKRYEDRKREYDNLTKQGKDASKAKKEMDEAKNSAIEKYRKFLADFKDTKSYAQNEKRVNADLKKLTG